MTAVETAPDLRRARVFVSVLGDGGVRKRSMQGLQSAHGILQRAVARELRLKHTPTLEFVYDDTSERGMRIAELIDREAERVSTRNGVTSSRQHVLDELRGGERFVLTTHEHPDGDALGSLAAMQQVLRALGKDAVSLPVGGRVPAALRVPLHRAAAAGHRGARRRRGPHGRSSSTAATSTATRPWAQAGRAHPEHRPPPRQHALRDRRPRRARRVLHGRDHLGPDARRWASS